MTKRTRRRPTYRRSASRPTQTRRRPVSRRSRRNHRRTRGNRTMRGGGNEAPIIAQCEKYQAFLLTNQPDTLDTMKDAQKLYEGLPKLISDIKGLSSEAGKTLRVAKLTTAFLMPPPLQHKDSSAIHDMVDGFSSIVNTRDSHSYKVITEREGVGHTDWAAILSQMSLDLPASYDQYIESNPGARQLLNGIIENLRKLYTQASAQVSEELEFAGFNRGNPTPLQRALQNKNLARGLEAGYPSSLGYLDGDVQSMIAGLLAPDPVESRAADPSSVSEPKDDKLLIENRLMIYIRDYLCEISLEPRVINDLVTILRNRLASFGRAPDSKPAALADGPGSSGGMDPTLVDPTIIGRAASASSSTREGLGDDVIDEVIEGAIEGAMSDATDEAPAGGTEEDEFILRCVERVLEELGNTSLVPKGKVQDSIAQFDPSMLQKILSHVPDAISEGEHRYNQQFAGIWDKIFHTGGRHRYKNEFDRVERAHIRKEQRAAKLNDRSGYDCYIYCFNLTPDAKWNQDAALLEQAVDGGASEGEIQDIKVRLNMDLQLPTHFPYPTLRDKVRMPVNILSHLERTRPVPIVHRLDASDPLAVRKQLDHLWLQDNKKILLKGTGDTAFQVGKTIVLNRDGKQAGPVHTSKYKLYYYTRKKRSWLGSIASGIGSLIQTNGVPVQVEIARIKREIADELGDTLSVHLRSRRWKLSMLHTFIPPSCEVCVGL